MDDFRSQNVNSLILKKEVVLVDNKNPIVENDKGFLPENLDSNDFVIEEKVVFNAIELIEMGSTSPRYLMAPFLPKEGTAVLAGKPDIGKSQFARQLCIQIALGEKAFLDFDLTTVHNRSMYVATEDNLDSTSASMIKQFQGLNKEPVENLRFVFADSMDQNDILKKLDVELKDCPVDLVVIDSFGDIFTGSDSNNNMAMRKTVKLFDKIAKKYGCLILFVHHINKGAYSQAPRQENIQGGSGLIQKVRLAIMLTDASDSKRYFSIVKGNYCPKLYKEKSIELEFSEENLLFVNTGGLILTSSLGNGSQELKMDKKQSRLKENIIAVFSESEEMSYGDILTKWCSITGQSRITAKRMVKTLDEEGVIGKIERGKYKLNIAYANDKFLNEEVKESR
ncbi:AAA family ATPase [uncultured Flavobacterium sp.]|uniref:AAA family ATPase n=1 Tax=uncultured Flavobacterium sp. TaxID=165435 RepID=UPI0025DFA0E8|nr:AAA family ATPase [uncultured Flavobacterium sp.]